MITCRAHDFERESKSISLSELDHCWSDTDEGNLAQCWTFKGQSGRQSQRLGETAATELQQITPLRLQTRSRELINNPTLPLPADARTWEGSSPRSTLKTWLKHGRSKSKRSTSACCEDENEAGGWGEGKACVGGKPRSNLILEGNVI